MSAVLGASEADEVGPESRSHKRHVPSADEEQTHSKLGSDTRPVTPAECAWNVCMRGQGQLLRAHVYTWPSAAPPHNKGVPPARREAKSAVMGAGVPSWTTSSAENLVLRPPPGGAERTTRVRARVDEPMTIVRPDEGGHQWKMTEVIGGQQSQSMAIITQSAVQSPVVMAPIEVIGGQQSACNQHAISGAITCGNGPDRGLTSRVA